ncbi:MAG: hypothetical protein K1Y02_04660 [Candidatus Hydrogenedentes bacterium]|nr:hypothetical protein [Candidatus Hydrogenedentota bacterium]
MIAIELKWALLLYASILGAMVLFVWVYTQVTVWRPHRYLGQQFLWRCSFCGYTYLDESHEHISQCPRCQSFNSATDANVRFVPARGETAPEAMTDDALDSRRNPSRRKRPHQRRRGPRRR